MVVKHLSDYMTDSLMDRVSMLQDALNQAEKIMITLQNENDRLRDVLVSLTSENNEGYVIDSEAFNEPVCAV